ncbi:glycosyltransferase [Chryseobacterium sp. G0162]|uniref:glycosyltransferase family 4 protein n=1 Tax=Chryseobacterium sp. G0162 TaxID=2487063 RepID=UPI000F4EA39B|nr:glycosyltransferase family 4 protein [Chryseobacterium sp. G0162]AZB07641.1 glycosyltransferase [Chryseobacterium sp. G0162]
MKVLHICNDYSYSKVYKNLYQELDNHGIEQIIYHPLRKESNKGKNSFEFKTQNSKLIYSSFLLKTYHRILFRVKIRILFKDIKENIDIQSVDVTYATTLFSDGAIAYQLKKKFGIPYVVAVRSTDVNFFLRYRPDLIPLMQGILQNASKIIFISKGLRDLFYNHPKIKEIVYRHRENTIVIPNGIENLWLENLYVNRVQNHAQNLLFVGRFDTNKNVENVIKALVYLKADYPNVRLNLVGGGGDKEQLVHDLIVRHKDWISYLGYIYDKVELLHIYRQNNYFIMPSIFETFGLVYIEALSQGLPVLYTKNQGIDGIFSERIGIGTSPDIEALVHNLRELLDKDNFDLSSIDFDSYNWCNIAVDYVDIFEEAIKGC